MIREIETLNLPEGNFSAEVIKITKDDVDILRKIYSAWVNISRDLNSIGARSVNLPEGLSESAFCLVTGYWRINSSISGANASMDCYDQNALVGHNRIQVKACSVIPDLTSFGPKTIWDRIFFVDFYCEGHYDGMFDVYEVNTDDINNFPVNANETLLQQKEKGRRPRFSIYKGLIEKGYYISKNRYNLFTLY